jgi:CheY-like chemotaxis protein
MKPKQTEPPRILVVVDGEQIRASLQRLLDSYGVQIAAAASVREAHYLINMESYDVLLSDWRMTEVGGGLTVVSALHNKNPDALTLVLHRVRGIETYN